MKLILNIQLFTQVVNVWESAESTPFLRVTRLWDVAKEVVQGSVV